MKQREREREKGGGGIYSYSTLGIYSEYVRNKKDA